MGDQEKSCDTCESDINYGVKRRCDAAASDAHRRWCINSGHSMWQPKQPEPTREELEEAVVCWKGSAKYFKRENRRHLKRIAELEARPDGLAEALAGIGTLVDDMRVCANTHNTHFGDPHGSPSAGVVWSAADLIERHTPGEQVECGICANKQDLIGDLNAIIEKQEKQLAAAWATMEDMVELPEHHTKWHHMIGKALILISPTTGVPRDSPFARELDRLRESLKAHEEKGDPE